MRSVPKTFGGYYISPSCVAHSQARQEEEQVGCGCHADDVLSGPTAIGAGTADCSKGRDVGRLG